MKKSLIGITVLFFLFCSGCENKVDPNRIVHDKATPRDTVTRNDNYIAANGLRQGHWIIFGRMEKDTASYAKYAPGSKTEEGNYKDDKKEGAWIEYSPEGLVKDTVMYRGGQEQK